MENYSIPENSTQVMRGMVARTGREEDRAIPPVDNMGVKNCEVSFHVDYLRVTAWIDRADWENVYDLTLGGFLGDWVDIERGGHFYKRVYEAHLGARLYTIPANENLDQRQITIELPGKACQFLGFERLSNFYIQLKIHSERVSVARIDLAFDGVPFTVAEFWDAVHAGDCRTYARRDTFRLMDNPYEKREDGQEGCSTVYVGNRESLRMLRVYDKHGPTRVEMEVKNEKALQIAEDLFLTCGDGQELMDAVYRRSIGHLRDFIDVTRDFWDAFTAGIARAYQALTGATAKEIDAEAVATWLYKQVSSAYSVAVDVYGEKFMETLLLHGRSRRTKKTKYRVILGEGI